jgi:hypothetical protein
MSERLSQRAQTLTKTVKKQRDRAAKKLSLSAELKNTEGQGKTEAEGRPYQGEHLQDVQGADSLLAEDFIPIIQRLLKYRSRRACLRSRTPKNTTRRITRRKTPRRSCTVR